MVRSGIVCLSLTAALALTAAVHAGVQERPDFSGRWTSEPEAPGSGTRGAPGQGGSAGRGAARGDMGSGWGATITIRQTQNLLTVEYAFFGRADMQPPLSFKYALDGTPTTNSVMMGRGIQTQTSNARWEGNQLVITTAHTFAHPNTGQWVSAEVRQTLSLEGETPALVVETLRRGVLGGPDTRTRVAYRKVE
jgi:hypothetical protein